MTKLNWKQIMWLDMHGERTEEDLKADDDGLYVEMSNGKGGITKIYLPIFYGIYNG